MTNALSNTVQTGACNTEAIFSALGSFGRPEPVLSGDIRTSSNMIYSSAVEYYIPKDMIKSSKSHRWVKLYALPSGF